MFGGNASRRTLGFVTLVLLSFAEPAVSQARALDADSLVQIALDRNPSVRAALHRVEAARARTGPAGALPDPMLSLGVMNLPVSDPGFGDFMTMTTLGLTQRLPYPGRRTLHRDAATLESRAAEAQLDAIRLDVASMVRSAYFDLALIDRSLELLESNRQLLDMLTELAVSRYGAGSGDQQQVLEARVHMATLATDASALAEARSATLADLNALLDRPSAAPIEAPSIPAPVVSAAVAASADRVRFTSTAWGARVSDSPLPTLAELQQRAIENSPRLRAHEAEIAAQSARVGLARRAHLPDFDVTLQYGHRVGNPDLASLMVAVPIAVHRSARQDLGVAEAGADLATLEAEHHAMVNDLRAEVAGHYAELERTRVELGLLVGSILPQGRAALESASASLRVGAAELSDVIERQAAIYEYELAYHRGLTEFAKALSEMERTIGAEVLP